jgi:hypothetical protein
LTTEVSIEQKNRPPPPKYTQGLTLDSANAQNTKEMLSKDNDIVLYIGNLTPRQEQAFKTMLAIGSSETFHLTFLKTYALLAFKTSCSKDGFRSKQIVEMNKASPIIDSSGIGQKIKSSLSL